MISFLLPSFAAAVKPPLWLPSRDELPNLAAAEGMTGNAIEIGVKFGHFSQTILDAWGGNDLYLLDLETKNIGPRVRRWDAQKRKGPRSITEYHLVEKTSLSGAKDFPDGYFGLIYIDALHSYEDVKKDFAAYWPKAKAGAVFAGHDYCVNAGEEKGVLVSAVPFCGKYVSGGQHASQLQVVRAVQEMAKAYGVLHRLRFTGDFCPTNTPRPYIVTVAS